MQKPYKLLCFALGISFSTQAQNNITTFAGNGTQGFSGDAGLATSAEFYYPYDVAIDTSGSIYIADAGNNRIRKVDVSGIITTVAGNGTAGYSGDNVIATTSELFSPYSIAFDKSGNLYIADFGNNRIRKVNTSGIITTIAGTGTMGYTGNNGPAISANISSPYGIAIDKFGNVFFAEGANHTIRQINTSGIITTFAGTGTGGFSGDNGLATSAKLNEPGQTAFDTAGNLYIADELNNRIRKVNTSGIITTIAGTGVAGYSGDGLSATSAKLNIPYGIKADAQGNIYFSDGWNNVVRKIDASGIITTIAGNGFGAGSSCAGGYNGDNISATSAKLNSPGGITFDTAGNLYIADICNNRIRKVADITDVQRQAKQQTAINIYPNPTSNSISLNFKGISNFQNATVAIQNTLGETMRKLSFTNSISIWDLAEGCYFLQVTLQNGETYKAKFIKQ